MHSWQMIPQHSTEQQYTANELVTAWKSYPQSIRLRKIDSAGIQHWNVNIKNLCGDVTQR